MMMKTYLLNVKLSS